ncbi:Rho guanyl nucleotide exchange factor [Xylaria sp. CBS 124048]|nr:Rho guanyl nucleotide exchange factor [Xylaria sp. CBS 124048]
MNGIRASQLSGTTVGNSASTTSLTTMSSPGTVMPSQNNVVATSNIINQRADASRSLYQICMSLKQRLAKVPGFENFMLILETDATSSEYNPVESVWKLLKSGDPLLAIYNALRPDVPLNPGDITADPARRPKAATFKFIDACLRQLQIPAAECFIVSDLMNEDTTGFVKVIQVINHVLDLAEERGFLLEVHLFPQDGSPEAPTSQMTYRDHIIRELVDTERKYVQDLENLHDLKKALLEKGVLPGDVAYQIFLNIHGILDFQRKFLIRIETTNSMPPLAQQWGIPFVMNEEGFEIYQPFIANQRKAAQTANQVFDKIQLAEHPVACDFNTLDGFLLKPMQRLVKYPLLLKDLLKKSEDPDTKAELAKGIEAAERVLKQANEAVNRELLKEAIEDLKVRVDDWKSHNVEQFGKLLLHGVYTVLTGRGDQEKDYEIYLFECILLCCKEVQPNKTKDKKDRSKSITKVRNKNNKLQLKGRIFMVNVTEVLSFAKPGSYSVQIWWKGDPGVENFTIKFTNEETMKKWYTGLDVQRKENTPAPLANTEQSTPDFTWMRHVNSVENPYAQQDDEDDDDDKPSSNPVSSPTIGYGPNPGVIARNVSSNSLRSRSVTTDSTQSLAGLARAPPQVPLPAPPRQLSVQTGSAQTPLPRGAESYFSPAGDSPASSRTSTASTLLSQNGQYSFPRTSTPQSGWEDKDTNRYTAPAMPRSSSRDGPASINGRNPRGPSLPVMSSQQTLAQQQRSRSYSTPDINVQNGRRANTTPVPAVPGIPAHLHHPAHDPNIPRSQAGSPRQDAPTRANTQSPGAQRDRLNQMNGQYGGTSRQASSSAGQVAGAAVPQPLNLDGRQIPASLAPGNPLSSEDLPAPTQVRVKVNCEMGTYVTLVVTFHIAYQSLIDRIDSKLARFTSSSIGKGNLRLKYRDEDGDLVSIESDDDLQTAFMEWREGAHNLQTNGVGEIELFCIGDMN